MLAGAKAQHRYRPVNVQKALANEWKRDVAQAQSAAFQVVLLKEGRDLGEDTTVTIDEQLVADVNALLAQLEEATAAGVAGAIAPAMVAAMVISGFGRAAT